MSKWFFTTEQDDHHAIALKSSSSRTKKALKLNFDVYSIGTTKSTKFVQMMILGLPLTFSQHSQISVLIAVATLEECCMTSSDVQRLIYSGERIVVHGPLVYVYSRMISVKSDMYGTMIQIIAPLIQTLLMT